MAKDNNFFLNKYKKAENKNIQKQKINEAGHEEKDIKKVKFEKIDITNRQESKTINKKKLTAIYSILVGIDNASKILKHLNDDEISIIIREIIKIGIISKDEIKEVESSFGNLNIDKSIDYKGGEKYAQNLLKKIYGMEKGSKIYIKIIEEESSGSFFKLMNKLPEKSIADVLTEESDMVISIIFSMMDSKKVADTLSCMPKEKALKIIKRMSQKIEIQPQILDTIVAKLKQKITSIEPEDTIKIHGKNKLVEILKHSSLENTTEILNSLEMISPALADELKEKLFTFEDIKTLPKKSLDYALKDYNDKDIAYMLKGADEEIKNIIFASITKKRRLYIEDEIKFLGKVKKSDVDEKRKNFINHLKVLESKGKIALNADNEIYIE